MEREAALGAGRSATSVADSINRDAPTETDLACLKRYFGHSAFRPQQWEIVRRVVVERRDQLVVMSTGG